MNAYSKSIDELEFIVEQIKGVKFYLLFSYKGDARALAVTAYMVVGVKGILLSSDIDKGKVYGDVCAKTDEKIQKHFFENGEITFDINEVIQHLSKKHINYEKIVAEEKKLLKDLGLFQ